MATSSNSPRGRTHQKRKTSLKAVHAAEKKLLESAIAGIPCKLGSDAENRPTRATANNRIRASFLRSLLLSGDPDTPLHPRGIEVEGAAIECDCKTPHGECLDLEAARLERNLALRHCFINGPVILHGARIGTLDLTGSQVDGLMADHIEAGGDIRLSDTFVSTGEVQLASAHIMGSLDCHGGRFEKGINAERASVGRDVQLSDGFIANQTVLLRYIKIEENLDCSEAQFDDANIALMANRAAIGGNLNLVRAVARGTVSIAMATIGGDFTPQHAAFLHNPSLRLAGTDIGGALIWRSIEFANGEVDFSGVNCTTINMDAQSWMRRRPEYADQKKPADAEEPKVSPTEAHEEAAAEAEKPVQFTTRLDNLTYKGFSNPPSARNRRFWIEWLMQQPDRHLLYEFRPQPWEQLAGVLDRMGHEEEARTIRIEKQRMQTRFMASNVQEDYLPARLLYMLQVFWRHVTGWAVDYGYRPGKALLWLAALTIAGSLVYTFAANRGIMAPTHPLIFKEVKRAGTDTRGTIDSACAVNWVHFHNETCARQMPPEYSEFSAIVYSMDVALPVVNLRQMDDWSPRVVDHEGKTITSGHLVRIWEWVQILLGWAFSLLFVSAIGGIIKR